MTHFGIICPTATGHFNPMTALGRELQRRGHQVTVLGTLDVQSNALAAGLEFRAIAESEYPLRSTAQMSVQLGQLNGLAALRYTVSLYKEFTALLLRDIPKAIKQAGVEALLVDETIFAGNAVAEFLQIPFVTVCFGGCGGLRSDPQNAIPPFFTTWSYSPAWWALLRNQLVWFLFHWLTQPIRDVENEYRRQWKLPLRSSDDEVYSKLAIISQQLAELEFSKQKLPSHLHFTGPL